MDTDVRVCPFCGEPPGAGVFCEACGRTLAGVERLPTRAEWADAPAAPGALADRCAAATEAFLAAMHAAGDPGATNVLGGGSGLLRRRRPPAGWVLRPVRREPADEDLHRYEPGLVLTTEGRFHRIDSQVRGWGQREFPVFADAPVKEPIELPVEERLVAELDAVLREHGVVVEPPLTSR